MLGRKPDDVSMLDMYDDDSLRVAAEAAALAAQRSADESFALQKMLEQLDERMIAMGVAGDEGMIDEEMIDMDNIGNNKTDPKNLNRNLTENSSWSNSLLSIHNAVNSPQSFDSVSVLAARVMAEAAARDKKLSLPGSILNGPGGSGHGSIRVIASKQMNLEKQQFEPPITDLLTIPQKSIKIEAISDSKKFK
jgi:hypothetical protein